MRNGEKMKKISIICLVTLFLIMSVSPAFAKSQNFTFSISNESPGKNTGNWTKGSVTCSVSAKTEVAPFQISYGCYLYRDAILNKSGASTGWLVADGKQKTKTSSLPTTDSYYPFVATISDYRTAGWKAVGSGTWAS
jgi:hypothetical protein